MISQNQQKSQELRRVTEESTARTNSRIVNLQDELTQKKEVIRAINEENENLLKQNESYRIQLSEQEQESAKQLKKLRDKLK